ncbi:CtpF protein, partial [bacterium]
MSAINYEIRGSGQEDISGAEPERNGDMEALRPLPRISIHAFCESDTMQRMMDRMG